MGRHIGTAVALVIAMGAAGVLAAERATFVLTNGERVSGEVVFHTDERTNIRADKNEFNVKVLSGVETPIPFSQVVAIDFAGGRPAAEELAALPASGHLLTMRDGNTRQGQLVDFIGGTTVKWRNVDGQVVDIPMTDVRRVFLRGDLARQVYSRGPAGSLGTSTASNSGTAVPSTRRAGTTASPFNVDADVPWKDTNLTVRRGELVQFEVQGEVHVNHELATGGAGTGSPNDRFPVPSLPNGALIGRIGTGRPFAIGNNRDAIPMSANGRLFLGINDFDFSDNSGAFIVNVIR